MNAPSTTRLSGRPISLQPSPVGDALKLCGAHLNYALFFSALVNIAYLAPTLYMLGVYDLVVPSGSEATLAFVTAALAGTLLTLTFLDRTRSRLLSAASVRLDHFFSVRLFRRALLQPGGPSLRLSQQLRDMDLIRAVVTGPAAIAVFDAPWIPIYVGVCFFLHPAIGGLVLGGAVVLFGLAVINERSSRAPSARALEASSAAYATQEAVSGSIDVVRALGMAEAFSAQFLAARIRASSPLMDAAKTQGRVGGLIRFLRLFLQSSALGLGAWLAIHKQISGGAIFAASMLSARALSPIDAIVGQWRTISQALSAYGQIKEQLCLQDIKPHTQLPAPAPCLEVNQISVTTPARERLILRGVSFAARGGQVMVVIGGSGAGKTTLMQALANATVHIQGEIRIDGARYADWDSQRLARHIGYVPQDAVLFPGSIKDNISRFEAFGDGDRLQIDERVVAAAKLAGVHDMILSLHGSYDLLIGPRGRGLSAGQQQRIALARAVYGDPKLFVLDEPDSNLDSEGEAALVRLIGDLRSRGALVIVATHRSGLIASADLLALMRDGRLERFGPRQDVLEALHAPEPPKTASLQSMRMNLAGVQ